MKKKVSDHYAIIPTEQVPILAKLPPEEQNIYDMIARSLMAAHEEDALVSQTQIETLVDGRATFLSKGRQVLHQGWQRLILSDKQRERQNKELPLLGEGDEGVVEQVKAEEAMTQPPKRFTEGQLITMMKAAGKQVENEELVKVLMESQGLGTEATRAGIITVLKDRGYMTVTKKTSWHRL